MQPQFDLESDPAFVESLDALGADVADFVIEHLITVASHLEWATFVQTYGWRLLQRVPVDTYPGANDYYCFDVQLVGGMLTTQGQQVVVIYAVNYGTSLVLCAVAR